MSHRGILSAVVAEVSLRTQRVSLRVLRAVFPLRSSTYAKASVDKVIHKTHRSFSEGGLRILCDLCAKSFYVSSIRISGTPAQLQRRMLHGPHRKRH
jgi:hypothetical protein